MVNGKKLTKVLITLSENVEEVAGFSVTPCILVLSVGDLVVATFSVEMSDSYDISSRSSVPVEVSKSGHCSTGVDSLANFLFPLPSDPCPARFSSMTGSGGPLLLTLPFVLLTTFDSLFPPIRLKLSSLCRSGSLQSFPQKVRSLPFFVSLV